MSRWRGLRVFRLTLTYKSCADITDKAHLLFPELGSDLAAVCVCWLLAPVDWRPRCLLQNWDLLSSARHDCRDSADHPDSPRMLRAVQSVVQKHSLIRPELTCLSCLADKTNDRLVRINDHIIPGLARQVTVSVLRFICVDLKILTALFGIFLQYQLNCYWLDHKTCSVESRNISHLGFSYMVRLVSLKIFIILTMRTTTSSCYWIWTNIFIIIFNSIFGSL